MNQEKIIEVTCRVCEVQAEDVLSKLRTRDISDARKIIAFLLLDYGVCFSVREAASAVGLKRNSAYVALNHFNGLLKTNIPFEFRYELVRRKLSE